MADPHTDTRQAPQRNVDLHEIAKFEQLADRWWDPSSEFRPLHDINPLRLNYIDERAGLPGKRVIDIGCGGGLLSEGMARRSANVTGIDLGEAPLAVARLHAAKDNIEVEYLNIAAEEIAAERAGQYDVVTCLEMLEHVPDPAAVVRACAELARPGGQLFFSTINRNPKAFLFAIVGAEYVLRLLPRGTHEYAKLIRPSELAQWCRDAGLEVRDTCGLTYNPLTQVYRLNRDVSVNYMMHAVKVS
ncbi:bifunctional 2-polyprenyl-6-hydroxyphenol methylase/3-demethylubiquinol 3-O-methyltransferase UbiG [Alcanivorax quisquiliarum]|uniref:Ubiquinone biosynthesis O-methyltransferase n=1 Tax=Alcanivorax quisquiliarum TaxID=2933565 RepID=A0ABT0EA43_9GAMM|nr:bifunctional 2-polyprenyl-6-hydroxyphenol methylase/3-demethylubiquinol 3-O-methyltransferase UbiG [Alcanivorax quisquiliarum]MCK0538715.1 bifunctional 2-polyprenyl-6-hydroxyphenol methylase/3-demethylubiquinol 3-O-methyltransferase UbiG [Alcanivorax quisquiliarum]